MNTEEMTVEDLYALAQEKEQASDAYARELAKKRAREELTAKYMDRPVRCIHGVKPYMRAVEFEDNEYFVDMRRVKSMDFLRKLAEAQDAGKAAKDGEIPVSLMLGLFDYAFAGSVAEKVESVVIKKFGYADFAEVMRIYAALFNELELKNS